jgi:hypothetical protein
MPFELRDFQDLVRLLREHPDWRDVQRAEQRAALLRQARYPAVAVRQRCSPLGPLHISPVYRRRHLQHDPDLRKPSWSGKVSGQNEVGEQQLC